MTKPEPKAYVATASNETSPKEAAEVTVLKNERVVGFTVSEDQAAHVGISGGTGLTWVSKQKFETPNNVFVQVWEATGTDTTTSFKPKFTRETGTAQHFWGAVQVVGKSSGFGKTAGSTNTEGAPSLSAETEKANSLLLVVIGDWNAKTGAPTWRTGAGAFTEKSHIEDGARYTSYAGYHEDAGAAGAKTVGLTAPTGQKYTIVAVEVFGEEGGASKAELPLGSAVGAASTSLALHAPTALPLSPAEGKASTALTLSAPSKAVLPLAPAEGAASTALVLHAPVMLPLGSAVGAASTAMTLSVPSKAALPFGPAVGAASTALTLATKPRLVLAPVVGAAATSMVLSAPTKTPRVAVVQEFPPDKLTVLIRDPATKNLVGRWSQDEPGVEDVFSGLAISSEMPGGYKEMSATLSRDPRIAWPDIPTYAEIEVQGPGREVVWSGYLRRKPATDGDHMEIAPAASGFAAMLDDDGAPPPFGYINSDLTQWVGPSVARRIELDKVNAPNQNDPQVITNPSGTPALQLEVSDAWSSPMIPRSEAFFLSSGAASIARLMASFEAGEAVAGNAGWMLDVWVGGEHVGDVYAGANGTIDFTATTPQNAVVFSWLFPATPGGGGGYHYTMRLSNLKVISALGQALALQGVWPTVGFTAEQMLTDAVPRFTPLSVDPELVEDDGFVITHAWYLSIGGMSEFVKDVTKYGELMWFVFGDRLLQYRFRDKIGRKWKAYAGPSGLKATGEDGTRLWDRLVVEWPEVDDTTRSAGPIGSGCQVETSQLELSDPDHPAVRARNLYGPNFNRRDKLVLNSVCTEAEAIRTGVRALAELNELDHSGEATLSGYIQDDKGLWYPASYAKAGDEVQFPDAADRSYRFITSAPYSDDGKQVPVTLDAPPEGIVAIQERFGARLQSLRPGG